MRHFYIVLILALATMTAAAQTTVSPVWAEVGSHKGKVSGEFFITNGMTTSAAVTVEPHSMHFANGKMSLVPLDPGIEVRLSETSARLHPQEKHSFEYDIKCAQTPCTVSFLSSTMAGHTLATNNQAAFGIRLVVMSTVYVCRDEKNCRTTTLKNGGM